MTFNEYQERARATAVYPDRGYIGGVVYTSLGLSGEAGEVANKVKKILRDSDGVVTATRAIEIIDEIGDVLWYCATLTEELGFTFDNVAARNLHKLEKRKAEQTLKGSGDNERIS